MADTSAVYFLPSLLFIMAAVSSTDISLLSEGNGKFTNALYDQLRQTPGNMFFSPISIEAVLALAHAGAGGNTSTEIQQSAFLPGNPQVNAEAFGKLMDSLRASKDVVLNMANALYADKQFTVKPEYLDTVEKGFKSELGQVNFAESEAAASEINGWVAKKTNNKIPKLFEASALTAATKLVLLNAIYFKGNWLEKFPADKTKKGDFFLDETQTKEVDFMTLKAKFQVNEAHDAYFLELPYQGNEVTMTLAVPKSKTGLAALEKTLLFDADINQLLSEGRKREVILTMPKFKLEQTIELNDVLQKLGIKDMFDERKADLSGISDVPLYVSKAVQKAFIEVNEEGSEAAAATGIRVAMRMMPAPPLRVTIDRPFFLYIRHDDITLFMGRLAVPN